MKLIDNQNLKEYNTFGMEVYARQFLAMNAADETPDVIARFLHENPYYILGGGSNTLFTKDFDGTIVHPAFGGIERMEKKDGKVLLSVAAGEPWENLIQYCIRRQLYGIENLTAIPGLVGSAPVQNIGAYGVEVTIFKQTLKNDCLITYVWFQLSEKPHFTLSYQGLTKALQERELPLTLRNVSDCVRKIRDSKLPDPKIVGNGGSFFQNPVIPAEKYNELTEKHPDLVAYDAPDGQKKLSAGQLIEKAGWKGRQVGNAGTWKNQALVLVNYGGATPHEVLDVAETIIKDVKMMFDVTLEMEINRI